MRSSIASSERPPNSAVSMSKPPSKSSPPPPPSSYRSQPRTHAHHAAPRAKPFRPASLRGANKKKLDECVFMCSFARLLARHRGVRAKRSKTPLSKSRPWPPSDSTEAEGDHDQAPTRAVQEQEWRCATQEPPAAAIIPQRLLWAPPHPPSKTPSKRCFVGQVWRQRRGTTKAAGQGPGLGRLRPRLAQKCRKGAA